MIKYPRLALSGLKGGAGKTIVSLGISRYWQKSGLSVRPFKKGPDYIDAMWLSRAAGQTACNLDLFFMSEKTIKGLFAQKIEQDNVAVIEGNRGLFDGLDSDGSCSTSELVKILQTPVILLVDCTKVIRTVAALVKGCLCFDPDIDIAGVILNNIANKRHREIIQKSLEKYTQVPVVGAIPRVKSVLIPERHMGLISDKEYAAEKALENIADIVSRNVDTDKLKDIATSAPSFSENPPQIWTIPKTCRQEIAIGIVKDSSLWFYYPENLEALERAGAELREVSLLKAVSWPRLDGLYLGGGFPETQAKKLSKNETIKNHVRNLSLSGLPIYAECGGFMYLSSSIKWDQKDFPMVDIFPIKMELTRKPQGHGYTSGKITRSNPFHPVGLEFVGHEFHYSRCDIQDNTRIFYCLELSKGTGCKDGKDGMIYKNTFACYTHLHALSVPSWAEQFALACDKYRSARNSPSQCATIQAG